jgi:RNA polymerase sigma-70 factor (ECF subfamily)
VFEKAMSDEFLLAAAKGGDQSAFKSLYEKYFEDLFQLARRRVTLHEDAADLVQEVFLSFYINIYTIDPHTCIGAYLFVSLRNKIFNFYAKESSRLDRLSKKPYIFIENEDVIWSRLLTKEIQKLVQAEINSMSPRLREIYQLNKEQMMTIDEISELLHISKQTVKNQLFRALEQIRATLKSNHLGFFIPFL